MVMADDAKKVKKRSARRTQKKLYKAALKMIDRWDENEWSELTVTEIARRMGVNAASLSRAFNSYNYIPLRRVVEMTKFSAFNILISYHGVRTVNEALEILDIRCTSHFIKRYKALHNQTPGEFCREEKKRLAKWRRERG